MHPRSTHCFHVQAVSGSEVCVCVRDRETRWGKQVRVRECVNVSINVCACGCVQKGEAKLAMNPITTKLQPTSHLSVQNTWRKIQSENRYLARQQHHQLMGLPKLGILEIWETSKRLPILVFLGLVFDRTSVESMDDQVMHSDNEALPHICCWLIGDYR